MNGCTIPNAARLDITPLDVAIFGDMGYPLAATTEVRHWTGTSPSEVFADAQNWDAAGATPQENWDAMVDNSAISTGQTVTVDADVTVHSLSIRGTAGELKLTVEDGLTLSVLDGVEVDTGGVLKGHGTIAGDVFVRGGIVQAGAPEPSALVLVCIGILLVGPYQIRCRPNSGDLVRPGGC